MHRYVTLAAFVPLVAAHGFIRSPAPRKPGDAFRAACGDQPFYQQSSDINGNVQGILQVVGTDLKAADCNLWLCKGFQFDDNKDNVQSYTLGEKIDFDINIAAPHTGIANVSVVKTSTNSIIGTPLIEFENYAANAGVAANNSAFSVTLPSSLDGDCTTAGDCVLQWYWDAADINQTYESCVDFTVGGSGNAPSQPETPASSAAPAPSSATQAASATDAATPSATPAPTSAGSVITTSIVPGASSTPEPEEPEQGDDDECPADDEDDEPEQGEGEGEGEDDECPADEEDDEPEQGEGEDDECPADEDDDEPEQGEGEDDECPADEEGDYDDDYPEESGAAPVSPEPSVTNKVVEPTKPATKPTTKAQQPPKASATKPAGGRPTTFSTIIREVTVTAPPATVTVTAPAAGECTTA